MLMLLLLAIIPGSQSYGFGMSVHKDHKDTCENSYDQEALISIAVAVIEENLYGDYEDSEDSEDGSRRRQLRGTAERDLTVRCDNGGYCLCPEGGGCGGFWCQWCTGSRRRLAVNLNNNGKHKGQLKKIENECRRAIRAYRSSTCWGPSVDIVIEL